MTLADAAYWIEVGWNLAFVTLLVLLNGFFVAAEFALVKVRESQIQARKHTPARGAAVHILKHLDAYLSACQLGITMASLALGWVGEPAISHLIVEPLFGRVLSDPGALRAVSITVAFVIITALHIVIGEQAPKSLAIRKPEATAIFVSLPLRAFRKVLAPLIWALNGAAIFIVRILGVNPVTPREAEHSIDELRLLLTRASGEDVKGHRSAQVASRVFALQELDVRDIMVPRDRMVYVDIRRSFDENLKVVEEQPFTRFPLADGGPDSILGFVHQRDVFSAAKKTPRPRIEDLRREVHVVPTTQRANNALFEMIEKHRPVSIVVNEFGVTVGMITLDDIFEELVGRLPEEFNRADAHLRLISPGQYLVDAGMPLRELQLVLREPLSDTRASTLAGLLINKVGRIPSKGEKIQIGNYAYWVKDADRSRVRLVEIRRIENGEAEPAA